MQAALDPKIQQEVANFAQLDFGGLILPLLARNASKGVLAAMGSAQAIVFPVNRVFFNLALNAYKDNVR